MPPALSSVCPHRGSWVAQRCPVPKIARAALLCLWTSALVGKGQMNLAKCGSVVPPAGPLPPELCLLLQDRIGEGRMCAELCSPCCPRRDKLGKAVFCLRVSAEPEALAAPHCKSTPERWPLERLSLTNLASQLHFQGSQS